ncbi:hypothetical protein OZ410_13380 [Robiginitalea sp. M366]|uniref:hypothetical protein n=1 Tax=Robiginitalea aestuariiviva TaxID=3036903 RepID=UPI00240E92BF|nr:hypothetical protein [Robiginitalea aestuariiviva]MDG1573315.1 hypothetical protein [Robiginitalea aestuariiviva]
MNSINRNEVLDRILGLLMYRDVPVFENLLIDRMGDVTMSTLFQLMPDFELEDWMIISFQEELIHKGFVIADTEGNLKITEDGKEFKRKGGYAKVDLREQQESMIREKTIEGFRYGEWGFYIAIIATIISLVSLFLK